MGAAAPILGLAGTAMQAGGGMMDMMNRQKAQKQQEQNLNNWYMGQAALRNQEMMRQRQFGFQADQSRLATLNNDVSGIAQKDTQRKEADRLTALYGTGTQAYGTPASDASIQAGSQAGALTGQAGGDGEFRSDLARRLNGAAQDARDRISALATINSYGDSYGGLGTVVPLAFQKSGWDISQANNFRRGSLQAYQVEKAIEPQKVQYKGSPAAMAMQAGGGFLSGLGGGQFS